jgi:hypothetical protein
MTTSLTNKQPSEAYVITFDFTAVVGTATIVSAVVSAVDQADGSDVSATLFDVAKQSIASPIVSAWLQNGTDGHNYTLTCVATCDDGAIYELDALLTVEDLSADSTTLVVEDGTIVTGANTYASVNTVDAYCARMGLTAWASATTTEKTYAIHRAMAFIEAQSFKGYKTDYDNPLKWPRNGMDDDEGYAIDEDEIPNDLINGLCRAAYEEIVSAGVLQKNVARADRVKFQKIDVIEQEWDNYDKDQTTFSAIMAYIQKYMRVSYGSVDLWRT